VQNTTEGSKAEGVANAAVSEGAELEQHALPCLREVERCIVVVVNAASVQRKKGGSPNKVAHAAESAGAMPVLA
jgi:hypothetical protein